MSTSDGAPLNVDPSRRKRYTQCPWLSTLFEAPSPTGLACLLIFSPPTLFLSLPSVALGARPSKRVPHQLFLANIPLWYGTSARGAGPPSALGCGLAEHPPGVGEPPPSVPLAVSCES